MSVEAHAEVEAGKFLATREKGEVSSLFWRPAAAGWLLVLGHGASTNMHHRVIEGIVGGLASAGIATFRYHFPYMEKGGKGRDSQATALATVRSAVAAAHAAAPELQLLAGGHSFGGRMTSLAAAAAELQPVRGLVYYSFPLHQPGKPNTDRAAHLSSIGTPMLFLTGTRDPMAQRQLLEPLCQDLGKGVDLHLFESADHGFKTLKRSGLTSGEVWRQAGDVVAAWSAGLVQGEDKQRHGSEVQS